MGAVFRNSNGGNLHLEFLQLCISDVIDIFQIKVPLFPLLLVTIGRILTKSQQFFEIQDGGSRHLEKYISS